LAMIRSKIATVKKFVLSGGNEGRFSADKLNLLAHLIDDRLYNDDLVDFVDEDEGLRYFKRVLNQYFGAEEEIIQKVRKKILSQSNPPFEGSRDWDILYKKYLEEEMRRAGRI